MDLYLNNQLSHHYKNHPQIIRIVTEDWMTRNMFCRNMRSKRIISL